MYFGVFRFFENEGKVKILCFFHFFRAFHTRRPRLCSRGGPVLKRQNSKKRVFFVFFRVFFVFFSIVKSAVFSRFLGVWNSERNAEIFYKFLKLLGMTRTFKILWQ